MVYPRERSSKGARVELSGEGGVARSSPPKNASTAQEKETARSGCEEEEARLDGSLQLFASDIDDREGGGGAIKSERASTTLRGTEKKFASKFRRCVGGVRRGGRRQILSRSTTPSLPPFYCRLEE